MQAVREKWTDECLDDLNQRVSDGFARVDQDIRDLRTEMSSGFAAMDARFDSLYKLLLRATGATIAVFVTTGVALVATQL